MPICAHCHKNKREEDFEFYRTLHRVSRWCKQCKYTEYRGFMKAARRRGPAGDAMRAHTRQLWRLNDWRCVYCATFLTPENITEDHVVPLAEGGTGDLKNLVFACRSCNSSKQNTPLEEWSK